MSMNPSTETARSSHHQHHLRHQQQLQQQQQHYAGGTNRHLADGIGAGLGSNHRSSFAQQRQAQAAMVPGVTQPTVGNESQSPASSTATACGTTSSASSSSNGSSGSNIFGRFVKKVVSSKTKTFASSPLTKTASSTGSDAAATVSKPKMLRTKVAKEPKVPVGVPLHVQTSNLPSGPVITGAVTKSPVAVSHCSPSKQLLNSLFSVSEPVKNLPNVSPSPAMVLNNLKAPLSGGGVNNGCGGDVRDGEKVADNNNDNSSSTCGSFANRGGERLRQSSLSHDSQLGTTETATLDTDTTTTEANKTEVGRSALDTVRGRPANVATVTQHNGKLCQPVGAIRRSVLTSDTQDSLSQAESLQQSTNGDKVTTTAATTRNSQSANVTGVVSSNSNSTSSQVCPVSGARLPFDSSPTDRTPQPPTTAPLNKLNNILNNGHIVNDLNNHTHHEDVPLDKLLYKPKMRRSISKDSIDEKFWNSINETQQLQDYLKNTSSMLKNLNMMNQVRGANFKNAHNHQFNNFHQYILQLQREKQDLQSQLIELVQNADLKRHEIEKLQKDLKQVKEKYYIHKQQVEEELAKSKDDVKIEDDKSVEYDDTQAGPSGFCNTGYEWDKRSSSSISELSVANLQDRINQMEETHYSTSEELQATVQELEDLRDQVTHLENNNEQLELDKNFLLGTLCEQTKKLENCLVKIDRMQKLLFSQYSATTEAGDEQGEAGTSRFSSTDREESLVELLRTIENEKNEILQKKNDLMLDYEDLRAKFEQERMELFEAKLKNIEQFQRMNEEDDDVESEIFVFRRPLHSARSLPDFQHPPGANSTSFHSLDDLDRSTETDDSVLVERLQFIVRQLQDQVAMKDVELKKIKEANILLESNHKDALQKSDHLIKTLENRNKELNELNDDLNHQLKSSHEAKMESEIRAQKNLDEKREIRTLLEDKDKRIDDLESKLQVKCRELTELADKITVERSEWGQFQNDLLTTVRVANEFKQETLTDCKKLQIERHQLEERLIATEQEVQRIKSENEKLQVALRSAAVAAAVSGDTNNSVTTSSVVSNTIKLPSTTSSDQIGGSAGVTNSPSKPSNLLIQKLKDFENVPESATPANTPTSPRLTYSIRQNNNKISVRSLVESIESKKSSGSTSPTNSACSTPSLCLRSNSVPVTTNEIISRSTQNGSAPATKTSTPNSNSVAIVAPTILKESPKPAESKPAIRADILSNKIRSTLSELSDKKDPLSALVRGGGSKRNALLKWCKTKTTDYPGIDITNFSSSWNDGLAFCAILHTYLKEKIPYETLNADDKHRNFSIAFKAAESVGISTTLELNEVISQERPDWHKIMAYVTSIYTHFET